MTRTTRSSLSPENHSPVEEADTPEALSPSNKKSKAAIRRQSLSRAREWAVDRKRKNDGEGDDDVKEESNPDVVSEINNLEEAKDEIEKLPVVLTPRRSTRKSRVGTSRVAVDKENSNPSLDDVNITSRTRRSPRRRTMNAGTPSTDKVKAVKTPTRRSQRRTTSTVVETEAKAKEPETPDVNVEESELKHEPEEEEVAVKVEVKEEEVSQEDIVVKSDEEEETMSEKETVVKSDQEEEIMLEKETVVKSEDVVREEIEVKSEEENAVVKKKTVAKEEEDQAETESIQLEIKDEELETEVKEMAEEEQKTETEVKELAKEESNELSTGQKKSMVRSLLHFSPVFFHALIVQWTLAFAIIMSFGFDWYVFEFGHGGDGEGTSSQRAPCVTLGLWLATIVGYAIAFGAQSTAGWILTGSSLAMASFSTKLMAGDDTTPVPSLPIFSISGFEVNVPDLLVVLCLVGCAAALFQQPIMAEQDPQVVANKEPPQTESSEETRVETFEVKEQAVPDATGPRSLIGHRIAVEKGIDAFVGTVKDYDSETCEWLVHYDDELQEEEELNRVQLGSAFKLYSKNLSDGLKAMWLAGEL